MHGSYVGFRDFVHLVRTNIQLFYQQWFIIKKLSHAWWQGKRLGTNCCINNNKSQKYSPGKHIEWRVKGRAILFIALFLELIKIINPRYVICLGFIKVFHDCLECLLRFHFLISSICFAFALMHNQFLLICFGYHFTLLMMNSQNLLNFDQVPTLGNVRFF